MNGRPPAFTLAELLVALVLGGVLGSVLIGTLAVQLRLARAAGERVSDGDALRTASHVLAGELRRITPRDLRASSPDSVAIRAFRGAGLACAPGGPEVPVRYRGDRLPDPRKDSVLVIRYDGSERAAGLVDVRAAPIPGECRPAPGEVAQVWTLSAHADGAAILLVFETGAYHLSARALRYRTGAEGRQPLTTERFSEITGFSRADAGRVQYTLALSSGASFRFVTPLQGKAP